MQGKDKIYLTGFMGSGKTTAGKNLAGILGWSFVDLDKIVEERSGMSIPEIFAARGEQSFRDSESQALRTFDDQHNLVISTGGGAPCHSGNMDHMLANGLVVYLGLTPSQLRSRLEGSQAQRPLIKDLDHDELLEFIGKKLSEREAFYNKSHLIIQGMNLDINDLVIKIKGWLK
jgi:shikimate kinase